VAKLADAPDLGSGLERGIGSNPFPGKYLKIRDLQKRPARVFLPSTVLAPE
jgi:hypothetical protein